MSTTLRDILDKLLGRQPASAKTASDRLQLVLAHDRSDLSPELLDQMRREIFEVVAKYVDIDLDEGEVSLETEDRMTALVANLPIKRCQAKKPSSSNESSLPPKERKATMTPKQESPLPPKGQESLLPIKETE